MDARRWRSQRLEWSWAPGLRWAGMGLGAALLAVLAALGVIAASVWIEGRHRGEETDQARCPAVRRLVTRPIVAAVGRQVDRYARQAAVAAYMHPELSGAAAVARFLDERVDLARRRRLAFRLARDGLPEGIAALRAVLGRAAPEDRAYLLRLIGRAANPELVGLLLEFLRDPDERVVLAVIACLPLQGPAVASTWLGALLRDPGRPPAVRAAAAAALGDLGGAEAFGLLATALAEDADADVAEQVLKSLGAFPFPQIAGVIRRYVEAPETPAELRVVATEGLACSSAEATPFLLELAATDRDEDVRAAAAWAVSAQPTVTDLGPALLDLVELEPCEDVRRRLYEALLPQSAVSFERLRPLVEAEADTAARVAGYNALGAVVGRQRQAGPATAFDRDVVPELVAIAVGDPSPNLRMRAVFALRRAQTRVAQEALAALAEQASPPIAAAARNGLWSSTP